MRVLTLTLVFLFAWASVCAGFGFRDEDDDRVKPIACSKSNFSEWCTTKPTSGAYTLGADCLLTSDVAFSSGTLEISGPSNTNDEKLPRIYRDETSTTKHRLFTLTGAAQLTIRWLKLEGGDANNATCYLGLSSTKTCGGGGIYLEGSSKFDMHHSIICNNAAFPGGGLHAQYGATVRILSQSKITNNEVPHSGGGGGMQCDTNATCIVSESVISYNTAFSNSGINCYVGAKLCAIINHSVVAYNNGRSPTNAVPGVYCDPSATCTTDNTCYLLACPPGTHGTDTIPLSSSNWASQPTTGISCTKCNPSTYGYVYHAQKCLSCPAGSFGDKAGQTNIDTACSKSNFSEWCTTKPTSGAYTLGADCLLTSDVAFSSGTLEISGPSNTNDEKLPRIYRDETSTTKHRLFTLTGAAQLTIRWLKLEGGDVMNLNPCTDPSAYFGCAGGAVYLTGSSAMFDMHHSIISKNEAYIGGGISAYYGPTIIVQDQSKILHNTGTDASGGVDCEHGATCIIRGQSIISNNTGGWGGGVGCFHGGVSTVCTIREQSIISYNTVTNTKAGGIACFESSCTIIEQSVVAYNKAEIGAGVYCWGHGNCTTNGKSYITDSSLCVPGTYGTPTNLIMTENNWEMQPECSKCPMGKFSSVVGATSAATCTDCPVGLYSEAGATTCTTWCESKATNGSGWKLDGDCGLSNRCGAIDIHGYSAICLSGSLAIEGIPEKNNGLLPKIFRDSKSASRLFFVSPGHVLSLNKIILTGGISDTDDGGAIFVSYSASCNIYDSYISSNTAREGGGAIFVWTGGSFYAVNSTISNNRASQGGGIWCVDSTTSCVLRSSHVLNNTGKSSNVGGGGVACTQGANCEIYDSHVTLNTAPNGGGVFIDTGSFLSVNTVIDHNTASAGGGGVCCEGGSNADATSCVLKSSFVSMNSANGGSGGGGILCLWTNCQILSQSVVAENTGQTGPGLWCHYPSHPGNCSTDGTSYITDPSSCLPGSYAVVLTKDNWGTQPAKCPSCSPGSYSAIVGATECTNCTAGKASLKTAAALPTDCENCTAGKYVTNNGASICTKCKAGTSSLVRGSKSAKACKDCPTGSYSSSDGAAQCTNCTAGKASPTPAASSPNDCVECSAGSYSTVSGAIECTNCTAGKASSTTAAELPTVCKECAAGSYAANAGKSNCTECSIGQYVALKGQSECVKCEEGKFANKAGSSKCIPCNSALGFGPCLGRGECDGKTGGCKCTKGGWEGTDCNTCNTKWNEAHGECDTCARGYRMWSNQCRLACQDDKILNQNTGICDPTWQSILWSVVSILIAIFTTLAFLYKVYVFCKLKREHRLNPKYSTWKAFVAVVAYGENGKHVVNNDSMETSLLDEEDNNESGRRDSFIEMSDRRASMDSFLRDADLSRVADTLERQGIYGTSSLLAMDEEDIETAGFRQAERKRFLKARDKVIAELQQQQQMSNTISGTSNNGTEGSSDGENGPVRAMEGSAE